MTRKSRFSTISKFSIVKPYGLLILVLILCAEADKHNPEKPDSQDLNNKKEKESFPYNISCE